MTLQVTSHVQKAILKKPAAQSSKEPATTKKPRLVLASTPGRDLFLGCFMHRLYSKVACAHLGRAGGPAMWTRATTLAGDDREA